MTASPAGPAAAHVPPGGAGPDDAEGPAAADPPAGDAGPAAPAGPANPAGPPAAAAPPGSSVPADPAAPPYGDLVARLAALGRKAVAAGLVQGSGGNLSARPPGADVVAVTATGTWLDELTPEDFSLVRIADGAVVGGHPAPSVELPLHLACYRVRADVNAVVHLHPQLSVLLTALGQPIRLITTDHAYYVREVRVAPYRRSGTRELADEAAALLADGGCDCVILSHHGCSVVADGIELAHKRATNLEEAALLTYRALLLGDTQTAFPAEHRAGLGTPP